MVYPPPGMIRSGRYQRAVDLAPQLRVYWRGTIVRTGERVTVYRTPPTKNTDVGWIATNRRCDCPDAAASRYGACKHELAAAIRDGQLAAVSA